MVVIRVFEPLDRRAVVEVWRRAGFIWPTNDPEKDIDRKVAADPAGFLVATMDGRVVGSVMVGYEGHRGWIQYLGVDPDFQRQGVGRALVEHCLSVLRERGCPKVNLQVRKSNLEVITFYESLGFQVDDVVGLGFRLEEDRR